MTNRHAVAAFVAGLGQAVQASNTRFSAIRNRLLVVGKPIARRTARGIELLPFAWATPTCRDRANQMLSLMGDARTISDFPVPAENGFRLVS